MNVLEYQEKAYTFLNNLGDPENYMHVMFGLRTETAEIEDALKKHRFYGKPLDVVNIKEEIGDLLWYIAVGFTTIADHMPDPFAHNDLLPVVPVRKAIARLYKEIEKGWKYIDRVWQFDENDKPVRAVFGESLLDQHNSIYTEVLILAKSFGVNLDEAMERNIAKLSARYQSGSFSLDAAANRDLKTEREILENNYDAKGETELL